MYSDELWDEDEKSFYLHTLRNHLGKAGCVFKRYIYVIIMGKGVPMPLMLSGPNIAIIVAVVFVTA